MKINFYTILCLAVLPFFANAQQLKINEVMASNTATLASDLGNFGDWVELYNPTNNAIDLAGLYFTDDIATPTKYQFPTGSSATIVPANGFKLIWADDSVQLLHANFKLSSSGETIAFFATDGITLLDSITFGTQATDISFGRITDGGATWTTFTTATPEASNDPTTLQKNKSNTDMISIYPNPTNQNFVVKGNEWDSIQILDLTGHIIMTVNSNKIINQSINIAHLNSGTYIIVISDKSYKHSHRIVKQ